jgi:predicted ATP-binding protein involved in virulence
MKITRIALTHIRCFNELEIQLDGKSALIIGDNGDGKSTVIRSLAMGLCDDSSAAALFRELHGETVQKRSNRGRIVVDLEDGRNAFRTLTTIKSLETFERVEQKLFQRHSNHNKLRKLSPSKFPWHRIFAAGYGAGIRVQGTADYEHYLTVDAVYPLFRYDAPLQNPELIVRRLIDAARGQGKGGAQAAHKVLAFIKTLLKSVLQLDKQDQLQLTRSGITVRGRWGQSELSSLGDGYRSTVTWILDLLSWWFLRTAPSRRPSNKPTAIRGIVLIDEVEQHLHPRWQRNIMRLLTESFPGVQFIATTHSPLVASGCEGIPVHRLRQGAHDVVTPFGWLAEDVYEIMDLSSSRATPIQGVLEEYERLDKKHLRSPLSTQEQLQLRLLRHKLAGLPSDDPVKLATELANLVERARQLKGSQS